MTKRDEGPDQARSWAIAMAGCVINSLLSGISRTTGLFYVALIETYGVSRMEANLPFTVRNVVRNLSSPLVGAIGQRYGARDITFLGGIMASMGIALCCFSPSVTWVTILWGGMHGLGVALGNTLYPITINQYFVKYRATASGISLSGACIGSFIFPAIFEYLLYNNGLSGTFLIAGGFIMHVMPAAILMKEPSWIKRSLPKEEKTGSEKSSSTKKQTPSLTAGKANLHKIGSTAVDAKKNSIFICNEVKKADEGPSLAVTRKERVFSRNGVDNLAFEASKLELCEKDAENAEKEFMEKLRMRTISIGETSISITFPHPNIEVQETSLRKGIVKVIKDPMFHVVSISMAGFAMLFDPAITVIVDYIKDRGLQDNDAKYFISMMSLGDLLGRMCFGWVTDRNYISISRFMFFLLVVQGTCFLLLPLFNSFLALLTIIMIYGLASGANLVLFPILVAKYLVSVQSLAIGSISFLTGILSFAIPSLIGYFRDNAGSYNGMFVITGSFAIATGCLWLFEPLLVRLQHSGRSASVTINP